MVKIDFKDYLINNVLKFWLTHAIDEKNGGIFTQVERDGTIYGEEKSVWFQGRALWVFAKAYNKVENNPQYLRACKKIYQFLLKCVDSDGRMFFTVNKKGAPIQKRRYYFSETFAAIGCAQYYKATGDIEVWKGDVYKAPFTRACGASIRGYPYGLRPRIFVFLTGLQQPEKQQKRPLWVLYP